MDEKWRQLVFTFVMSVMLPVTMLHYGGSRGDGTAETVVPTTSVETTQSRPSRKISVRLGDRVEEIELDSYITGVVLAEMPAAFEEEALKAQAVAARTYTLRCSMAMDKHPDAAVCTDSTCCQAYLSPEEYMKHGGKDADLDKVRHAVKSTAGDVLTYDRQMILAAYFSCSGGKTEDALEVWGGEVPYLQSVDSPGEEIAEHYRDRVFFSRETLEKSLGISLWGTPGDWIGPVTYTAGGGVDTMYFAGKEFTGQQLRANLGLYSASFFMEPGENGVYITTIGKGHRVGMSQWGANAMAKAGCDYQQILLHFYTGVTIDKMDNLL